MMQLQKATDAVQALAVMVEATSLSHADASKLTALLQSSQESSDSSDDMGAPAAANYKGKSGGIVETMQDLYEKGEAQLAEARKAETKSVQAYQMLAQSLKDEIQYANKDLEKAKKNLGASNEAQATAEGDLAVTQKDLDEEVKALATAKKIIVEATSGAASQSYSFVQTQMSSGADLAKFEAIRFVRDLAQKQKSPMLAQLAQRMAVVIRSEGGSGDPFAKVKGLISNMIEKLLKEAEADATEKAYCDKE